MRRCREIQHPARGLHSITDDVCKGTSRANPCSRGWLCSTPSGMRSNQSHPGVVDSVGPLLTLRASGGNALRRKAVTFTTSEAARTIRRSIVISAIQSDRGDHPSPPFGVTAGACALWNASHISPLAFHRSDLPLVPPFGTTELDAQDMVARSCFGLPEVLLSDIKVKIGNFSILMLIGLVAQLLALMARSMKEEISNFFQKIWRSIKGRCAAHVSIAWSTWLFWVWTAAGACYFLISDPHVKRRLGGFVFDPLRLVVNGFEWTRVPALELAEFDRGSYFDQITHPSHGPSPVNSMTSPGPGLKAKPTEASQLVTASTAKLGKVYKRKTKFRKPVVVHRSSRIAGKICKSSIQNATLIKATRNEGAKIVDSTTAMRKEKSDRLGSFVSDIGNALERQCFKI
ncbi:hypothetical protein Cni_G07143 [Canna indica]|uniref:Uncharacterized protein n=1 Tax=Canna indica TaxID=4628 RepID=A0AAQ3JY90_9LILI|nr:hypothetical protein Cni_G07143 [Canna indica]